MSEPNDEIKDCPFCGQEAILELDKSTDDAYVICKSCMVQTNHYDNWRGAVNSWNARTTPLSSVVWPAKKENCGCDRLDPNHPHQANINGWNACHDAFMSEISKLQRNEL